MYSIFYEHDKKEKLNFDGRYDSIVLFTDLMFSPNGFCDMEML